MNTGELRPVHEIAPHVAQYARTENMDPLGCRPDRIEDRRGPGTYRSTVKISDQTDQELALLAGNDPVGPGSSRDPINGVVLGVTPIQRV